MKYYSSCNVIVIILWWVTERAPLRNCSVRNNMKNKENLAWNSRYFSVCIIKDGKFSQKNIYGLWFTSVVLHLLPFSEMWPTSLIEYQLQRTWQKSLRTKVCMKMRRTTSLFLLKNTLVSISHFRPNLFPLAECCPVVSLLFLLCTTKYFRS